MTTANDHGGSHSHNAASSSASGYAPHGVGPDATKQTKLVYAMFFLSGFSALIYEVAWLSRIQLVMGHTVYSLATTLASYLAGLALGAWGTNRLLASQLNPLTLYVLAEALVGLYGLAFTVLLALVQVPYGWLVSAVVLPLPALSAVQFFTCGAVIAIPTILMGTTLPLLAAAYGREGKSVAKNLPVLYAVNTFGAVAGSLASGLFIMPALGYERSIWLAAGINITILLLAGSQLEQFFIPAWNEVKDALRAARGYRAEKLTLTAAEKTALLVLFLSGLASMFTQFIWNRLAALGFGPHTYIFPLTTAAVLLGIVAGSWFFRRVSADRERAANALQYLPVAAGIALIVGNAMLARTPALVLWLHQTIEPDFALLTVIEFAWLCICCAPAATLLGALFPMASCVLVSGQHDGPRALGLGYAVNILGLITGAFLGSFVMMPLFGMEAMGRMLLVGLAACGAAASLRIYWKPVNAVAYIMLALIAARVTPPFDKYLLTSGYFYNRTPHMTKTALQEVGFLSVRDYTRAHEAEIVAYRDDPHATVSIHQGVRNPKDIAFKINGKVDGNNTSDLSTTRFVSLLPWLMKQDAATVLTIGLGTGSTVAETLRFPRLKQTTVIELSAAMAEFSKKHFSEINGALWEDPRFRIIHRDGRDFLDHTRETFDLVISEPSNPWVEGIGSLFTEEYYRSISKHLNPGGVASLWFHSYGLDCISVRSVMAAARAVFPTLHVFRLGGDLYMLAANEEPRFAPFHGITEPTAGDVERDLIELGGGGQGMTRADGYGQFFRKTYIFGPEGVARYTAHADVNRDDNQLLQYLSGRSFYTGVSCSNYSTFSRAVEMNEAIDEVARSLATDGPRTPASER